VNITIQFDIKSVKAMQTQLSTQMIPVAFARALNKTAQSAQSTAIKTIAQEIGTPQKVIKPFLSRRLAQRQQLTAVLSAPHSRRLPLLTIDPQARQNQRGVMVRAKGQRRQLDHAFIAVMMKNGHRGAYSTRIR
jgi:Prophage minor tail protein Z (GPZ)